MGIALVYIPSAETLSLVTRALTPSFEVFACGSLQEIRERLDRGPIDVVLIDLGTEGGEPGLSFCAGLRAESRWRTLPMVFLSSTRDTAMTVRAFEVGCDDLVHVPFAAEEFRARVWARFKRLREVPIVHDLFWKADLRFSLGTQRVVCTDADGERDLELTPNEFKILYLLARHDGTTLSRQLILSEVWGENLHVVERTVDKHICSLRRKMRERAQYVASVPGAGYCFSATANSSGAQTGVAVVGAPVLMDAAT